jgi:hypothetical protein
VRGLRKTRHSSALQRVRPQPLITACGLELTADLIYTFSHSSFGPPFHHAATCPTSSAAFKCNDQFSAALKRPKSRVLHGIWRAPPENWGGGSGKRVEERGELTQTHNVGFQFPTIHTYTSQYLLHFDYEAFVEVSGCHNESKRAPCSPG